MRAIRKCELSGNDVYKVQVMESTDAGKSFHYAGIEKTFSKEQDQEMRDFIQEHRTPLKTFPVITGTIQKRFEMSGIKEDVPCICGYRGRACRQMEKAEGTNRFLCNGCPLSEYAKSYEMEIYALS